MSHAPECRRLSNGVIDVDFYRREAAAIRRTAMREAFNPKAGLKIAGCAVAIGLAAAAAISAPKALAQASDAHRILAANEIKWSPAPASMPMGSETQ